jgi:hypothetical protein
MNIKALLNAIDEMKVEGRHGFHIGFNRACEEIKQLILKIWRKEI